MLLTKEEDTLTIKLEDEDKGKTAYDIITDDEFFWKDLTFCSSNVDGWEFLFDANRNLVFRMNDYGWDWFTDLIRDREITLYGMPNDENFEGYEWTEGVHWDKEKLQYEQD